jgi:hypothetical protein
MELKGPEIPMVCGATGDWLTEATAKSDYWATQIRQTVRFANALDTVTDGRDIALLEVGPGATLSGLARQHLSDPARRLILCSLSGGRSKGSETESLWRAVASLWLDGQTIDWTATRRHELRRRVHLPTYPFERRRFWVDLNTDDPIEAVKSTPARAVSVPAGESRPDPVSVLVGSAQLAPDDLRRVIADIWQTVLGVNAIEPGGDFFLLGGDSLLALQVAARVRAVVGVDAPASLFFEARTVDSLVVRILGLKSSRRNEEIGALLDQVEALTDDEVRALLARERAT